MFALGNNCSMPLSGSDPGGGGTVLSTCRLWRKCHLTRPRPGLWRRQGYPTWKDSWGRLPGGLRARRGSGGSLSPRPQPQSPPMRIKRSSRSTRSPGLPECRLWCGPRWMPPGCCSFRGPRTRPGRSSIRGTSNCACVNDSSDPIWHSGTQWSRVRAGWIRAARCVVVLRYVFLWKIKVDSPVRHLWKMGGDVGDVRYEEDTR